MKADLILSADSVENILRDVRDTMNSFPDARIQLLHASEGVTLCLWSKTLRKRLAAEARK